MGDADERLAILPFLDGTAGNGNIYEAIGVEPIINCRGTFTIIGGSVELAEVVAAMDAATASSCNTTSWPRRWAGTWPLSPAPSGG